MLLNGWHSDKAGERRWHAAIPLACAGIAYLLLLATSRHSRWLWHCSFSAVDFCSLSTPSSGPCRP
jgi:hypothetical protein